MHHRRYSHWLLRWFGETLCFLARWLVLVGCHFCWPKTVPGLTKAASRYCLVICLIHPSIGQIGCFYVSLMARLTTFLSSQHQSNLLSPQLDCQSQQDHLLFYLLFVHLDSLIACWNYYCLISGAKGQFVWSIGHSSEVFRSLCKSEVVACRRHRVSIAQVGY